MNPIIITTRRCKNQKPSSIRFTAMAAGAALLVIAGLSSSCSTARGFGQDVEKTGDKIQEAASN